jgi:DNA-binding ferritin-like protein
MNGDVLVLGVTGVLALAGLARRRGSAAWEYPEGQRSVVSEGSREHLVDLLAALRALHWSHWTTHWQAHGDNFYGDHLLFERLYTDPLQAEIDGTAERIVAYAGSDAVNASVVGRRSQEFLDVWAATECPYKRALEAENDLQAAIRAAYTTLSDNDDLSLGLDDWLMGLAQAHDTNRYLLQQRLGSQS